MSGAFNPEVPDFSRYSLALFHDGEAVFASTLAGLRPLILCVHSCMSLYSGCVLHDKVTGFAAARLLAHSGFVRTLMTGLISAPARKLLSETGMDISAAREVARILTRDGLCLCPMEERALKARDNEAFFREMQKLFSPKQE